MQHIVLTVPEEKIGSYTALLQFGIYFECQIGQPIGVFLSDLPGFDKDYIVDRIQTGRKMLVCLKLFNMIASEKGPGIFEKGGVFQGGSLLDFFQQRSLLKQQIKNIEIEKSAMAAENFWHLIDSSRNYHVTILSQKNDQ
jgi:hypothetical protein